VLLAWKDGQPVGCAALRQVDAQTGEMKRVYVRPTVRGENLGRRLVEGILDAARHAGYTRICLDVLPEFQAAQRLYESLGFVDAEPVSFNPVPGTRYLGLALCGMRPPAGGLQRLQGFRCADTRSLSPRLQAFGTIRP
jgi:predicted N-acetyltransferase YhbS